MTTTLRSSPAYGSRAPTGIRARAWGAIDRGSIRPGYRLTPERVWAAFRQAELGDPTMQCDMIEDIIEPDGHTRGQYLQRIQAVAERTALVAPGGNGRDPIMPASILAATELQIALGSTNLNDLLWHMMDALFFGYSGTEIQWGYSSALDLVVPRWFHLVEHRRFRFDENCEPLLIQEENVYPGEQLEDGKWIWSQRRARIPARAGIGRTIASWSLVKRLTVRDWIVFAEKFGIPIAIGTHDPRATPAEKLALVNAMASIGSDGFVLLPETCKMIVESFARSGDVAMLHPAQINLANAEISKVITGATLTTENAGGPGSFALGKVHQTRADALSFSDALWCARLFYQWISIPFIRYNPRLRDASPPELYIHVQPEQDVVSDIQVAKEMHLMGIPLDLEQIYRRSGWRRPSGGTENTLAGAEPPPKPVAPSGDPIKKAA